MTKLVFACFFLRENISFLDLCPLGRASFTNLKEMKEYRKVRFDNTMYFLLQKLRRHLYLCHPHWKICQKVLSHIYDLDITGRLSFQYFLLFESFSPFWFMFSGKGRFRNSEEMKEYEGGKWAVIYENSYHNFFLN